MPFHNCWVSGQLGGVDARCSTKKNFTVNPSWFKSGSWEAQMSISVKDGWYDRATVTLKSNLESDVLRRRHSDCFLPVNCACTAKIYWSPGVYLSSECIVQALLVAFHFQHVVFQLLLFIPMLSAGLCAFCVSRCVSMALTVCQCKDWPQYGEHFAAAIGCSVVSSTE